MEKPMTRNVQKTLGIRVALAAAVAFPLIIAMSARAQEPAPPPPTGTNVAPAAGAPAATEATAERVIVTGSNIPTAEEVGPNPVDTYRRDDITRLGVRTSTDLVLRFPAPSCPATATPTLVSPTIAVKKRATCSQVPVTTRQTSWFTRGFTTRRPFIRAMLTFRTTRTRTCLAALTAAAAISPGASPPGSSWGPRSNLSSLFLVV